MALEWCQEVPALSRRTSLLLNCISKSSERIYCEPLIPLHPQVPLQGYLAHKKQHPPRTL